MAIDCARKESKVVHFRCDVSHPPKRVSANMISSCAREFPFTLGQEEAGSSTRAESALARHDKAAKRVTRLEKPGAFFFPGTIKFVPSAATRKDTKGTNYGRMLQIKKAT